MAWPACKRQQKVATDSRGQCETSIEMESIPTLSRRFAFEQDFELLRFVQNCDEFEAQKVHQLAEPVDRKSVV